MSKTRYMFPILFAISGIAGSIYAMYYLTIDFPATFDFLPLTGGTLWADIAFVLIIAIPIIALEYLLLGVPVALALLSINKIVKAKAYDTSVMEIGKEFGSMRIIRRTAAPALFAFSSSGLVRALVNETLFPTAPVLSSQLYFLYPMTVSLIATLLLMPVALLLFIPTWMLNDAGIVNHLKKGELRVRQCPDTEGVGRWYGNMLGGFSLIALPLSMFYINFYLPYIAGNIEYQPIDFAIRILMTIGVPVLVMAFIIPIALLNERLNERVTKTVQNYARKLRSKEVLMESIKKA